MTLNEIEVFLGRTTLRQIEVMSSLRMYGSMSKAAGEMGMSVANVSRVSKRFEANLNVSLFHGNGRRFSLRPEGIKILDLLLPLTGEIAALRNQLQSIKEVSDRCGESSVEKAAGEPL